jgi:hypothetical protein
VDVGIPARRIRIISGAPERVEHELNQMLDTYTLIAHWIGAVDNQVSITAMLMHNDVIDAANRKRALAMATMMPRGN